MQFSPIMPTAPFQPALPLSAPLEDTSIYDTDIVYLRITISGEDIYDPGCLILGDGEAQLRWTWADDMLRWLGNDANVRWEAQFRLGTGQC